MSIIVQHLMYQHPDKQMLFKDITFTVNTNQKAALIGNNGTGKSTILKIIAGLLQPNYGEVSVSNKPYFVPQHFGQYNDLSIAQALNIDEKLKALEAILKGDTSEKNFNLLNDDWTIEERVNEAFNKWDIAHLLLNQKMENLSGGEKTKVFLTGIHIHAPEIILFDEPSNHLDTKSREQLYELIGKTKATMLIVSHDRSLLNLLDNMYEINKNGITFYGGNYEFYKEQRHIMLNALQQQLDEKEKKLRLSRKIARETAELQQKRDARGKKKSINEGVPRIMMKSLKNNAEKTTAKLKDKHSGIIDSVTDEINSLRNNMPENKELKISLDNAGIHTGKILVTAKAINFSYGTCFLWNTPIDLQIKSGDRVQIKGDNGSGKSTLLNILLGILEPTVGLITRAEFNSIFVDQEYSIINNQLTVFEQVEQYNSRHLQEHELKTLLHRFLFPVNTWDKTCGKLSGGEKMKLVFCCLTVSNKTPDILALDEPTNNLDIQSMEIITSAVKDYRGTILLISHDSYFAYQIGINLTIEL